MSKRIYTEDERVLGINKLLRTFGIIDISEQARVVQKFVGTQGKSRDLKLEASNRFNEFNAYLNQYKK